jgi:hypothetical protein
VKRLTRGVRSLSRALYWAILASCLALQLSGTIHLALVQHAICAEHGEAMDVGDGHGHLATAAKPAAARAVGGVYAGAGENPASDAHHHCPLDEDRNTHALVVYAALVGPQVAVPALPPPHAQLAKLAPRELQLLAPKTSPPA